jgi:hypothetical protein
MTPKKARMKRGWTHYAASQRMPGVGHYSLVNLERNPSVGGEMKLRTAIAIIEAYWPDVTLADLLRDKSCPFKLVPNRQPRSRRSATA